MRWLDALGVLKWPSVLLVASPLAAYPFWLPAPAPATYCGMFNIAGGTFSAYRVAQDRYILRPSPKRSAVVLAIKRSHSLGFDSGGMVLDGAALKDAGLLCLSAKHGSKG